MLDWNQNLLCTITGAPPNNENVFSSLIHRATSWSHLDIIKHEKISVRIYSIVNWDILRALMIIYFHYLSIIQRYRLLHSITVLNTNTILYEYHFLIT
jgi:hypothetical protein